MRKSERQTTKPGRALPATIAIGALIASGLAMAPMAAADVAFVTNPASYVNTLAGTGSGGPVVGSINNFPGPAAPYGMVQFSPDIPGNGAGYYYNSGTSDLRGFSLNHASQGCGAFGDFPVLPTTIDPTTDQPWNKLNSFDHSDEVGEPGYYRLTSKDRNNQNVTTELTATDRTGVAVFTFPAGTTPAITIRAGVSNGSTKQGSINVNPNNGTITGWTINSGFCGQKNQYRAYFTAKFEQAFTQYGAWNEGTNAITTKTVGTDTGDAEYSTVARPGGFVRFANGTTKVRMKISLSYVRNGDLALGEANPSGGQYGGSAFNLATEVPTADYKVASATAYPSYQAAFDAIRSATFGRWNNLLSKVKVSDTATERDVKTFYHSLYRTFLHPNILEDTNGDYPGFEYFNFTAVDGSKPQVQPTIHNKADSAATYGIEPEHVYANFSDWDTYRSWAPLAALITPDILSDVAQTYVLTADQSGQLSRWALANSSTDQMSGDNASALLAQVYAFGARDFAAGKALHYMYEGALGETAGTYTGGQNPDQINRPGAKDYTERKYAPQTPEHQTDHAVTGASVAQEWAIDDYAISVFARTLGAANIPAGVPADVADQFAARANYWENHINPLTMCLSARDYAGRYPVGSNCNSTPGDFGHRGHVTGYGQVGFDEAVSEQYLWMAPQNLAGLASVLGGRDATAERLDEFMTGGYNVGANVPKMWAGNEPNFATPWAYNYVGRPWRTQEVVDDIRNQLFGTEPHGAEPGNDDLGAMSAWYVWAALGVYPATPGTDILTVNSPNFEKAQMTFGNGKTLTINAPGATTKRYIAGLSVNGAAQTNLAVSGGWLDEDTVLDFTMSSMATTWGTGVADAPPSFAGGSNSTIAYADPVTVAPGATGTAVFAIQRAASTANSYSLDFTGVPAGFALATTTSTVFDSTGHSRQSLSIRVNAGVADGDYLLPVTTVTSAGERSTSEITVRVARASGLLAATTLQATSLKAANAGHFDGNSSIQRDKVETAGLTAGTAVDIGALSGSPTLAGLSVTLPKVSEGLPDAVVPNGQTIALQGNPTKISFLGAARAANTTGTAVVVLDNGAEATADLSLGDWVKPSNTGSMAGGNLTPFSTNTKVIWTSERNGQNSDPGAYIYATLPYTAPGGRTIAAVRLTGSGGDNRRVFGIAQDTAAPAVNLPTQSLSSTSVTAGNSITITGANFAAGEVVTARLGTHALGTATATASGAVVLSVTVPKTTTAGTYQVQLSGPTSGVAASTQVTVAAATWTPTISAPAAAQAGSQVVVTGSGFAPSEQVTITLGSHTTHAFASASGNLTASIAAPATTGTQVLTATGELSGTPVQRSITFTPVTPVDPTDPVSTSLTLSLTPAVVVYGQTVTARAQVAAGTTGTVEFFRGNSSLGKVALSGTAAQLRINGLAAGTHTIRAELVGTGVKSRNATASVVKAAVGAVKVSGKKYTRKKATTLTVKVGNLTGGQRATGKVRVYVGKKVAKTVTLKAANKGTIKVKIAKKFTTKKTIKVKAVFTPADTKNVIGGTSTVKTIKARR